MNVRPYLHVFALISITAMGMQLVSDFWLPLVLGAGAVVAVALFARR
ncbi:MAG: hypothetical protein RLZZ505_3228 [Verrucomicrobiota bacterium]|jgi:hypothetical protein